MRHLFTIAIISFCLSSFAQTASYNITGRVNAYNPKGKIYVILCDKASFETTMAGIDTIVFWVNYDRKAVEYKFTNIPEGEYALRTYQDVNGNHKFDKSMFGPLEPWAYSYSGPMNFPPVFSDVSFLLVADMRINLTLGK